MASLMIHQIIGQKYCENHHIADVQNFLSGNLAPDLVKDKSVTHFSRIRIGNKTYTESILNKVNLTESCKHLNIDNDFHKGEFLHLVTDHVFFFQYLLNNPKYQQVEHLNQLFIRDMLYRDYHRINGWLIETNPNLDISLLPDNTKETRSDDMEILSKDAISEIIEFCSHLDLESIFHLISNNSQPPTCDFNCM